MVMAMILGRKNTTRFRSGASSTYRGIPILVSTYTPVAMRLLPAEHAVLVASQHAHDASV